MSLTLNAETALNVSVSLGDGVTTKSGGSTIRTIDGVPSYQFTMRGIGPKLLDEDRTFEIVTTSTTATVTFSPMANVRALMVTDTSRHRAGAGGQHPMRGGASPWRRSPRREG